MTRPLFAEFLGTTLLLATVIGSGIMGDSLAAGNVGVALLANSIATGCILAVLIFMLAPVSGAHFNPAVTLAFCLQKNLSWRAGLAYTAVQIAGGLCGMLLAHLIFDLDLFQVSSTARSGSHLWVSEAVATAGLILAIMAGVRCRPTAVPWLVGAYITAAYWFTSSTSFANPAVTIARAWSDTFAGIQPDYVLAFVLVQLLGAALITPVCGWLFSDESEADLVASSKA